MKKRKVRCSHDDISRRDFLKKSALLGAGLAVGVRPEFESIGVKVPRQYPRIVRAYSPNATNWDYESDYYFDYIDQDVVNEMVRTGIRELTKGDYGQIAEHYTPGDKWAIKINCVSNGPESNEIDATAPVIIAVLILLIEYLGIPPSDIYIYDVARFISSFRIRDRIPYEVNYVQSGDSLAQADPDSPIEFRNIDTQYMPYVISNSQHVINIPLFKDHSYCLSTMAFKNHFGTTRPGPSNLHPPYLHYNLSDLNANSNIRYKTRLIVADALFGIWDGGPYGIPMQWDTFPGGATPNSIFLGFDPVAHESVMIDYLIEEQEYHGVQLLSHDFLHDAMEYHNLGVHEHRDEYGNYHNIDNVEIEI